MDGSNSQQKTKRKWKIPNELVTVKRGKRSRPHEEERKIQLPMIQKWGASYLAPASQSPCTRVILQGSRAKAFGITDWCLKSKIRIVSKHDFEWMNTSRPHHEAKAIATLLNYDTVVETEEDPLILFHQSLVVWTHPYLPFVDLFPRVESKSIITSFSVNEMEAATLKEHWSTSLHSVLQLLQCGHCPYFYVCANSLTILFLSGEVVKPDGVAFLVPTSPGFQDALKREGIPFTMPYSEMESKCEIHASEGVSTWFKSVVAQDKSMGKSLVRVEGSAFNGLVSFMLKNKTILSGDGRLAGIPPTLLAPVQFLGATLLTLKVKRCQVQDASREGELTKQYCIDLSGPILPHNVQLLTNFLNHTQQQYSIEYHKCEATSSFNDFHN